ncbi:MAG: M81 family metallopeptidase [Candidatus Bathyarchaeia archaeon]
MRVIIGGISHETNTFNTIPTSIESFRIIRGDELLKEDLARTLLYNGVEVLPAIYAYTLPSGIVDAQAYSQLKGELVERVKMVNGIDGVCLILHGAMVVEGIGSAELDLVKTLREVVGEGVIISASLDLHGNIPEEIAEYADILTAYRTTPHLDVTDTRKKAANILIRSIKSDKRPKTVVVKPPVLLPGEYVVTDVEPAAGLYRMLRYIDLTPGIIDSSLFVGMAWADVNHAGASALAVADGEENIERAYEKACEMANTYWHERFDFRLEVEAGQPKEVVRKAKSSAKNMRPVLISDSGDNITAGGAGDVPLMLEELVSSEVEDAVIGCILDRESVEACRNAGAGASLKLEIGGKLDKVNGHPFEVRGRVLKLTEEGVVFRVGGVDVIITTERTAFTTPGDFISYGIDPRMRGIVVVKLGLLTAELKRIAAHAMMALTPGFTNLLIEELDYRKVRRPIFPIDRDFDWRC